MRIHVEGLSHTFLEGKDSPCQALENINLQIDKGKFVVLLGPSGCGKSTFLRILSGLLTPTHGRVLLDGEAPLHALACKRIGWMAQKPALLPWRTVRANIAIAQGINPQTDRALLSPEDLLQMVGLKDFADAHPFTLSGGMQHRVALARTLALGADLWLMDEPFAALDEMTRETLADELLWLWREFSPTVVWVTHHIYEAVRLADRIVMMTARPGRILAEIDIPLARPRLEDDHRFGSYVAQIRQTASALG
jgi:NitT/TauT family transport system ATP-binding protein